MACQNGHEERSTARTGQPAVRHVAAVERAFAVLDALSDGGELGHERDRAAHRDQREHRLAAPRDARLGAVRRARAGERSLPALAAADRARQRRARPSRPARRSRGRTCRRSSARPARRRRSRLPGEHDAITVDFAHSSSVVQSVAQLGRPSVGHATAAGKVMLAFGDVELPAEPFDGVHPAHDHDPRARSSTSSTRVASAGSPKRGRSAKQGLAAIAAPVWDSRGALAGIVGLQGPASRFDARAVRAAVAVLLEHTGAALDRARLPPSSSLSGRAARRGRRRARGSASSTMTSTKRRNANWMPGDDRERDQDRRDDEAAARRRAAGSAAPAATSAPYSAAGIWVVFHVFPHALARPALAVRDAPSTAPQSQVIVIGGSRTPRS